MNKQQMIDQLTDTRTQVKAQLDAILVAPTKFGRSLSPNEGSRFTAAETQIKEIDERIAELTEQLRGDNDARAVTRQYTPAHYGNSITEPEVYTKRGQRSFFRDAYYARQYGDRDALERLDRNNRMVTDAKAARGEERAISTGTGAGGELVPPLWLEQSLIALARPSRTTADLATGAPLPPGTDTINIPRVNTGTATAVQATQNTGVQQTDLTTTSVSSPVITIAGGQTVSLQLMEQSPLNIDTVILGDLAADYAVKLDLQVLSGSGGSGQVTGLFTLSGTNSVTWTQATPALGGAGGLYAKLASAVSTIFSTRYAPPTAIIMHPRRWAWAESQSDTQNRPLVLPTSANPMNAMGTQAEVVAEGAAGTMLGLPVYLDPSIPTNTGAGSNQDTIVVTRASDQYLWEGQVRAEAFQQTYAQNASVFIRLYNYAAYIPGRYPNSIALVTGSGAVTPTF